MHAPGLWNQLQALPGDPGAFRAKRVPLTEFRDEPEDDCPSPTRHRISPSGDSDLRLPSPQPSPELGDPVWFCEYPGFQPRYRALRQRNVPLAWTLQKVFE